MSMSVHYCNPKPKPEVGSDALFDLCAETKLMKDGSMQIHCKRGLWGVSGHDHKMVRTEAYHYWMQYQSDGEYNSILSNAEVSDAKRSDH